MTTRLQKLLLTIACGAAIGLSRCHAPEVEHPPAPPPDVAADAGTDDAVEPGLAPAPAPENEVIAMYGVAYEPD